MPFEKKDVAQIDSYLRLSYATLSVGILSFLGASAYFVYGCTYKILTGEVLLYIYAGFSVGFAFTLAGLLMARQARFMKRLLKKYENH